MIRALFIFLFLASVISCKENKAEEKDIPKVKTVKIPKQELSLDKIRFDFNAKKDSKNKGYIKIDATLYNDNIDTVYFLTGTDHGLQYSLQYDTSKFNYFPESIANVSDPEIGKIPPKGLISFDALFEQRTKDKMIRLEIDFCRVEKDFDMEFTKVAAFKRNRQKTILATTEKAIE